VLERADELFALDEALAELALKHPDKADLVKLRDFAGLRSPGPLSRSGLRVNGRPPLDLRPRLAFSANRR
jgi:hypothetical protein